MNKDGNVLYSIWLEIRWYLVAILATIIIMFNCKGCHEPVKEVPKKPIDTLTTIAAKHYLNADSLIKIADSLKIKVAENKRLSIYYMGQLRAKYDSIYVVSDTVCQKALKIVYDEAIRVDSTNKSVIANQEQIIIKDSLAINELQSAYQLQIKQHRIDSSYTHHLLNDSIPGVYKNRFWKGYFKGFKHGAATGIIITEGVNLYVKVKP